MAKEHKYNITFQTARIIGGSPEDSKFYKEVLAKAKADFPRGYEHISYNINPEKATSSNFFFVCLADEILGEEERIARIDDWNYMFTGGNFAQGIYFNSNQLILRSRDAFSSSEKNGWSDYLIKDISRKLKGERINGAPIEFSKENPLLITGAKLKPSFSRYNPWHIVLSLDNVTLQNDVRFSWDGSYKKISLGGRETSLWVTPDGLSMVYLLGKGTMHADHQNLNAGYHNGRLAVVKNN